MAMPMPESIVLSHLPKESRSALFSSLLSALQPDDQPSIDFVASAIAEGGDVETRDLLVKVLQKAIVAGKPDVAASIAQKHTKIGGSLFAQSAVILSRARCEDEHANLDHAAIASHLHFCKSTFSHLPIETTHKEVLSVSLDLLGNADRTTSHAARDLIFAALSSNGSDVRKNVALPLESAIWTQIQNLVRSDNDKRIQVLGYSLWLRRLLLTPEIAMEASIDEPYWFLLLHGLRRGDAEIRKLCLNVIKLSLASQPDHNMDLEERAQLGRYATVFETIVLGRYINQIQECEPDLDDFNLDTSDVDRRWLYTLLASALDSQMQDSNRKFIGNWIMRAQVHPDRELVGFLRDDFLPWATQGSLFVASLKRNGNGDASCSHGERLASYLTTALQGVRAVEHLRAIVWSYVTSKKTFSYGKVWLLKALSESMPLSVSMESVAATSSHGTIGGEPSAEQILRGLPDAAHDYVSNKLVELGVSVPSEPSSSRRDLLENEAIAKCSSIDTLEGLNDLWGDLDYLEFPKGLLFHIPNAILSDKLVDKAMSEQVLAVSLQEKVTTLQKVAHTKTYLVSPLNTALRSAVLRKPQAFDLLSMTDYIIQAVDKPPEPTIDLMLEEATVHLFAKYGNYFGERPSCGVAALLDLVSRLRDQQQLGDLIERLMQRWKAQKIPPPTVSSWKTVLQLQTLLLCLENLRPTESQARQLVVDLLRVLSIEPLPTYRYLLEWMIVRLLQRLHLEGMVLDQLASKDHHSNPKYLASLMKIGSIVGCSKYADEEFGTKLATLFVPLAASSKIVIRHEAQWQVPILLEHARSRDWSSITKNPALAALDEYIRSLERFRVPPPERQIGRFDPETHHTLTNLVQGAWSGLDSTEAPLTSREDFLKIQGNEVLSAVPESCMPLGDAIPQQTSPTPSSDKTDSSKVTPTPRTIDDVTALQTKGTAYLVRTLTDPSASTARPNNLIVVGSLVDNPYNLGGLSRVSEIFGASGLTLQNQNVIGNKDFTSVSVSSHLHFPIIQLSAPGVPAFLAEQKAKGFTVVGIEQTDRSVILGSEEARLPEKCVLVVGSEKEGIPAVVLTECDVLVEIPQNGVTRSLNVQTAVSVVLFEYVRQHGGKK